MRYYSIVITDPSTNNQLAKFSSLNADGSFNGSNLQVELDIFQTQYAQPASDAFIKIYGVGFEQLNQKSNFNGMNITVSVGMSKGLPYANPKEIGMIISGTILQAFGNWQGTQISLDLVVTTAVGSPNNAKNLSFDWKKGQTLESAVRQTLQIAYKSAYPNGVVPINGGYSSSLIFAEDQPAVYQDLFQFAQFVEAASISINKTPGYLGAQIAITPNGFNLSDGTSPSTPTQIAYTDIVGNLTWIDIVTIQAKVIMRGDLQINQYIKFPKNQPGVVNIASSYGQFRNDIAFDGVFQITQLHHMGNSRQSDGNSWVTVINAVIPNPTTVSNVS